MSEELVFSLDVEHIPVKIDGKEYYLKEGKASDMLKYQDAQLKGAVLRGGDVVGYNNLSHTEAMLVSICLFDKATDKTVPVSVVNNWPGQVVKKLYNKAREVCGLDADNVDEMRKKLNATEAQETAMGNSSSG